MLEVQDIFHAYGDSFRREHNLSLVQHKAMSAIEKCRTAALGGHTDICDECGYTHISYNSCRNRHCPKCQTLAKERWIDSQKSDLLDVGYFHVVFTLPDELNGIVYQNQQALYNLLFMASAETLSELALDKRYLGAKIGLTSVLHTWGQNLMHHPHIHCIVPGGGQNILGKWVSSKKKFFIPIKVLSRKFRGKFLYYLQQAKLEFHGSQEYLINEIAFRNLIGSLYNKEWIVYCKPPFKNAACVVEYLGRYTHRVAISNNRILSMENSTVSFKWRDYRDNNRWKVMTVTAHEFIRRFLIHVLPKGFMKIRHYGFLGNRNKSKKLMICKRLTRTVIRKKKKASTLELITKLLGRDICKCPACGSRSFGQHRKLFTPNMIGYSPPARTKTA
jgi:hypothetical protein